MSKIYAYLLIPFISLSLVTAQTLWASAVKSKTIFNSSNPLQILQNVIGNEKIWLGAILYLVTTGLYFYLFSKLPFFVIQISVTALAIIFSALIATFFFHEALSLTTVGGIVLVGFGLGLIILR